MKLIKNYITKCKNFANKTTKRVKNIIKIKIAIFKIKKIFQNSISSIINLKPNKTKLQIILEQIISIALKINEKLLFLTDKILFFYKEYIEGKPKKIKILIKSTLSLLLFYFKNIWHKIVEFYKKDKKRAIIYFLLIYILYKCTFSLIGKISSLFVSYKNEMVVLTREVKPEKITKAVNCYGYIESENNLTYTSEVRGNIDKIYVKEKQMVKEGDLIMVLDSKFTKNSYISAKSVLESKKLQYSAIKKLYQDGLESIGNLKSMEADLENANSTFESAKKAFNGLAIRAPFDGYIDNIENKEGSQINAGTRLFTLERTNAMQVKCEVPNLSTDEVKIGDDVKVYVGGYEMATGKLSVIGDSVDVYSGSRGIVVNKIKSFDGFEDKVKPGVSVMIKVMAKSQKDVYKISAEALEITPTGAFMVKILNPNSGSVFTKDVYIYDEHNGIDYVVGLDEGDYVIERGHEFVDIGEKNIKYDMVDKPTFSLIKKLKEYTSSIKNFALFVKKAVIGTKNFFVNSPEFIDFIKEDIQKYTNNIQNTIFKVPTILFEKTTNIKNLFTTNNK